MSLHNGTRNTIRVDPAKLSDARIKAGMAMSEVAKALSCNKSQVSRWEQGQLIPSEERIMKMAEMYKTGNFIIINDGKLWPEKLQKIRELCKADVMTQKEIGEMFGVSRELVGSIYRETRKEEGPK